MKLQINKTHWYRGGIFHWNEFRFNGGDDLKNNEGNTPLHLACEKPNLEIILFLLMQGTDYTTKNTRGYKPG